jgi:hypothetical protein
MLDGGDEADDGMQADVESSRPMSTLRISPRLSLLLIGGAAMAGIVVMCLAVVVLALWQAS